MNKHQTESESTYFTIRNVYAPQLNSNDIKAMKRVLSKASTYRRHDEIKVIIVLQGTGVIDVNGKHTPLKRGTFVTVTPFQFHRILPDSTLEFFECHVSIAVFLYIVSSPCYNLDFRMDVPERSSYSKLISDEHLPDI